MQCHVCGSEMEAIRTAFPFKVSDTTIVVLRNLPLLQCKSCGEYLFADRVFAEIEKILSRVGPTGRQSAAQG